MATYTHGHAESVLRSHRSRTAGNSAGYLLPRLHQGQSLLDIGSGPGTITADLARIVAPGPVTALEANDEAIALTKAELDGQGVDATYVVGDVHALDLPSRTYDVTHAHQVLQHLPDPVGALREMGRVTRPGGVIAVRDADYAAFTWWPRIPALDEWLDLYRRIARHNGAEPDAGRRLLSWARAADLQILQVTSSNWTYATPTDRRWWGGLWADRITGSAIADQATSLGWASQSDLERIADGWREWAADPDGWFMVPSGELIAAP
ncbi:methyltransferase family protein [Branchiibius hedensis]|uniref:Methyltransferase domain-containing protein n=1 Tax=Branchiibius hedensis TaxID=672460 RepID=A0A2Y8ZTC2_9MICO|nr:methyltransferase domain-containing protein [Branchiibius hedensis]PWJ25933.1 methyltransferase family protein [Branchiibius hedensis]SSA34746.1 Methyltransferase domain-containing protein [Branchiibius hedensis]